jgi:hypothetical protein
MRIVFNFLWFMAGGLLSAYVVLYVNPKLMPIIDKQLKKWGLI